MSKQEHEIIPRSGSKLFIDIGNSSLKAAFTEGRAWKNPNRSGLQTASDFVEWFNRYSERFELIIIISVVRDVTGALVQGIQTEKYRILQVDDIPADLIDYETPETLGLDRFFGCYGAVTQTQKAVVVIDAGSACTIDYMAADFLYRGGIIMPGLTILEDALKEHIPSLPMVERDIPDVWPGKSTKASLQWGITGAYIKAIEGMLEKHRREFGDFELVLTGGYADLIARYLDRELKVRSSLVFDGMRDFLKDYL